MTRYFWLFLAAALVQIETMAASEWQVAYDIGSEAAYIRLSGNNTALELAIREYGEYHSLHQTVFPRNTEQLLKVPVGAANRQLVYRRLEEVEPISTIKVIEIHNHSAEEFQLQINWFDRLSRHWSRAELEEKEHLLREAKALFQKWRNRDTTQFQSLPSIPLTYARLLFAQKELVRLQNEFALYEEVVASLDDYQKQRFLYILASVFLEQNDLQSAHKIAELSWQLLQRLDIDKVTIDAIETQSLLGLINVFRGAETKNIEHMMYGQQFIEQALEAAQNIGDYKTTANLLSNKNVLLYMQGKQDLVEENYSLSLQYHQRSKTTRDMQHTLNNFAMLKRSQGDYLSSLRFNRLAIEVLPGNLPQSAKSFYYATLGNNYLSLGDFDRAKIYFEMSKDVDLLTGNRGLLANAEIGVASIFRMTQEADKAVSLLLKTTDIFEGLPRYKFLRDIELGNSYLELEKMDSVAELVSKVLVGMPSAQRKVDEVDAWLFIATAEQKLGNHVNYTNAVSELASLLIDKKRYPLRKLAYLDLVARYNLNNDRFENVDAIFQQGLTVIDDIFKRIKGSPYGLGWRSRISEFFELYFEYLVNSNQADTEVWQNKLLALLHQSNGLNLHWSRSHLSGEESVYNQITSEREQYWRLEQQIIEASPEHRQQLIRKKHQLSEKIRGKLDQILLQKTEDETVSVAQIDLSKLRASLAQDEILVITQLNSQSGYLVVVTKDSFSVHPISSNDLVVAQLNSFRTHINTDGKTALRALNTIWQSLPLTEIVSQKKHVYWLSNDVLQLLPVNLFLANDAIVYYMNTLNIFNLAINRVKGLPHSDALLYAIIANPGFENHITPNLSSDYKGTMRSWRENLPSLPWSSREAQMIQEVFGEKNGLLKQYEEADNGSFSDPAFRTAKIAHIATHAYYNPDTPDIVGLATATGEGDSDGFITISELLSKPFYNDLVVLSGCETMLGQMYEGEGYNSLSRAMLSNGAGATIATLWPVADKPTALFMEYFYQNLLQTNGDLGLSLSNAQNALKKKRRYKHPRYWAGFVLTLAHRDNKNIDLSAYTADQLH